MFLRFKSNYLNIKNSFHYYTFRYLLYLKTIGIRAKLKKINSFENAKNERKIVIFGSSEHINDLTLEEKSALPKCKIIYMNKNLIFWKHINIWPDYYFLSDNPIKSNKALIIFIDTLKKIIETGFRPPILLVEKFYEASLPVNTLNYCFKAKKSINLNWAQNLDEELFGYFGSLTTLLNLISVLNLGKEILLIGFDMKDSSYFFEKDKFFKKYIDQTYEDKTHIHPNARKINNKNIFTHWNIITKNLENKNIRLFCNNKNSLLVENRLVKYISVNNFLKSDSDNLK